mmetsp:Transcript_96605/g.277418  ORF Transcript_96605/g.277418 Transcript_96605/m.277418 type:complete len:364 (+) Transcript_96605:846-1937(+)
MEVDLGGGVPIFRLLVVLGPLDRDLSTLVLDAVELHSDIGAVLSSELELRRLPLVVASSVLLRDRAREDGCNLLVASLLNCVRGHCQDCTIEELNELLTRDAQGQVLEDQGAVHHLLIRELRHAILDCCRRHHAPAARDGRQGEAARVGTPLRLPLPGRVLPGLRAVPLLVLFILFVLFISLRGAGSSLLFDLVLFFLLVFSGPRALPFELALDFALDLALDLSLDLSLDLRLCLPVLALHVALDIALPFQLGLYLFVLFVLVELLGLDGPALGLDLALDVHLDVALELELLRLHPDLLLHGRTRAILNLNGARPQGLASHLHGLIIVDRLLGLHLHVCLPTSSHCGDSSPAQQPPTRNSTEA